MLHGFTKEEMLNNSKDKQGKITILFSEGVMLIQEIVKKGYEINISQAAAEDEGKYYVEVNSLFGFKNKFISKSYIDKDIHSILREIYKDTK